MVYVKNVPAWERVLRLLTGVAGLIFAYMNWGVSNAAVAFGVIGAVLAVTGLVGFCPLYTLIGRKLDK